MNIATIITTLLSSCFGPGTQDYGYNVGTGYKLVRTSGHQISVIPENGNDGTKPEIKPKVVQIAWNEQFVMVKQFGLKRAYPDNPNNTYEVPDENQVQYFILDTIQLELYGGYDLNEFSEKRKLLGISDDIKLKDVNSYPKGK